MDHDHRHTRDDHTSKVSEKEKEILNDITCVWNLKYDTEELIQELEKDSQSHGTDLQLTKRKGMWWGGE